MSLAFEGSPKITSVFLSVVFAFVTGFRPLSCAPPVRPARHLLMLKKICLKVLMYASSSRSERSCATLVWSLSMCVRK